MTHFSNMKTIAPSILGVDYISLKQTMMDLNQSEAAWLHLDVMDGNFVPNLSFGAPVIKSLKKHSNLFFDVHMMVNNPDHLFKDMKRAGADLITVHYEACKDLKSSIANIKDLDLKAGIAISPDTDVSVLDEYLDTIDHVLVMSVHPGYGGQKFIESGYDKVLYLSKYKVQNSLEYTISVDGGVDTRNINKLSSLGANVLVAGSAAFKDNDTIKNIKRLHDLMS